MDPFALIAVERRRLAKALMELTPEQWSAPSLCGNWSNHEVAAHLNVPFELKTIPFLIGLAKARGNFDRANERFAQELASRMSPEECVAGLKANAKHRFTPPGYGPEAPLTDVIVHGEDILRPLGQSVRVDPAATAAVLHFMMSRKAQKGFGVMSVDDVHFEPNDVDVSIGHGGQVVNGPALSMVGVLVGRKVFLDDLTGPGADLLRSRM